MSANEMVKEAWAAFGKSNFAAAAHLSNVVLQREPKNIFARTCNAMCHIWLDEDTDTALRVVKLAVKKHPEVSFFYVLLGRVYSYRGEMGAAASAFEKALELEPNSADIFYNLTSVKKYKALDEDCRRMLEIYERGGLSPDQTAAVCSGLAKVYDDVGMYEQAFDFCMKANAARKGTYAPLGYRNYIANLKRMQREAVFDPQVNSGVLSTAPVFIVGMARSGTTLAETILGRHPDVFNCGEMPDIAEIEGRLVQARPDLRKKPNASVELLQIVAQAELEAEATEMLSKVEARAPGRFKVFTDKMPMNGLKLGMIAKLFPKARIIYMHRHPLDCCISNLFASFGDALAHTRRQDWMGDFYRANEEIIEIWRDISGLPILDVHYEELVSDPERVTRSMVEFVGLRWDDRCLDPSLGKNEVRTASVWQARQPINQNSVARWRRYEPWIQPLIEALGGYEALGETPGEDLA